MDSSPRRTLSHIGQHIILLYVSPLPSPSLQTPEQSVRDSPTPGNEQETTSTAEAAGEEKEPGTKKLNVEETESGSGWVKLENNVEFKDKSSEDGVKAQPVIEVRETYVVMKTTSASEQSKGVGGEGEGEEKEVEVKEGDGGVEREGDGGRERREEEEFGKFETGRAVEDAVITADFVVAS